MIVKITLYLVSKLAGAGFALTFIFGFLFLLEPDLYKFSEMISTKFIWLMLFCYGLLCSVFIDLITGKMKKKYQQVNRLLMKFELYIFFGFAVFLLNGISYFTLIAGLIGALCSLLFYLGTFLSQRSRSFNYLFSIVMPLCFFLLLTIDFTEKKQWNETRTDSSYSASFQYFNGEHEIPLKVTEGQTLILSREFVNENGGGNGFHVLDDHDKLVGMTEINDQTLKLVPTKTGIYKMVVTGDSIKGSFKIIWRIE